MCGSKSWHFIYCLSCLYSLQILPQKQTTNKKSENKQDSHNNIMLKKKKKVRLNKLINANFKILASAYIDVTETFSAFSRSEFILRPLDLLLLLTSLLSVHHCCAQWGNETPFSLFFGLIPPERIVSCKICSLGWSQAGCSYFWSVTLM